MLIKRSFGLRSLIAFSGHHIVWLTIWAVSYTFVFEYFQLKWMVIPWVPLAVIGTAVAFYLGFQE